MCLNTEASRSGTSSAKDPGERLHPQTDTGDSEHHLQGIQESFYIDRQTQKTRNIICRGSRRASTSTDGHRRLGTSSAEDLGELLHRQTDTGDSEHHLQRIQDSFYIDRRTKEIRNIICGGSRRIATSTGELKERLEDGRTRERLVSERTRERQECERIQERLETRRTERQVGIRANSRKIGNQTN